jgi:hypothetical protein
MPRALLALSFAALAACAGFSPVSGGMDETGVQARLGKPETVRKNPDGSETWEYPGGPLGRQTYMVTMGSDHAVKDVRQVLSEEYFSQVKTGMSREDVRQLLGKPGEVSMFGARDEEVWSWRYLQGNPMFFNVLFDRSAGTVRTTQRLEEILFLDQDC